MYKKLIILPILLLLTSFSIVNAEVSARKTTLTELVNDDYYYLVTDTLTINQEEVEYIDQVDFTRLSNLRNIEIKDCYGIDLSKIMPVNKVYLSISNCVLDFSKLDFSKFNYVSVSDTFDTSTGNITFPNNKPINSQYEIDPNYDERINDIAKEIYNISSDPDDIIKNVTDYVINLIDYDYNGEYTNLGHFEAIFEHNMGVCGYYSDLEAMLLNKLGIFAISVGGYIPPIENSEKHAWVIVYKDGKWYGIDPTWLDSPYPNQEYYMSDLSNSTSDFNATRIDTFTLYDKIPVEKRISNISIIDSIIASTNNNTTTNEETISNNEETEKNEIGDISNIEENNPSTGEKTLIYSITLFISFLGIVLIREYKKKLV